MPKGEVETLAGTFEKKQHRNNRKSPFFKEEVNLITKGLVFLEKQFVKSQNDLAVLRQLRKKASDDIEGFIGSLQEGRVRFPTRQFLYHLPTVVIRETEVEEGGKKMVDVKGEGTQRRDVPRERLLEKAREEIGKHLQDDEKAAVGFFGKKGKIGRVKKASEKPKGKSLIEK